MSRQQVGISYQAIVIGASAGGLKALSQLMADFDESLQLPVLITKHLASDDKGGAAAVLNAATRLNVVDAKDKQILRGGTCYLAPANYHMLVENEQQICLSMDEKVCHSRPSIDVLFQSAAWVFGDRLVAVILTGANDDGSDGVRAVKAKGGVTIAQNPESAEVATMPKSAIATQCVDHVLSLEKMSGFIQSLTNNK